MNRKDVLVTQNVASYSNSTTYSYINFQISTNILLVILSFSSISMFIVTIVVVAPVVLISLFYLYLNEISKDIEK